jgi:predicted negative regulator of RcsB-dependent stress response
MDENLIEGKYNVTKKSRLLRFYESNKLMIFATVIGIVILTAIFSFYLNVKKQEKISLTEKYIQAKIYIEKKNNNEAKKILEKIILSNDSTYSTLSLFLVINENLIKDKKEISLFFDHILKNNNYDIEIKNLIIFKRALFESNFINELELLDLLRPLTSKESIWKPHALLFLGDYFSSKKEYVKAREFYNQVLLINNLNRELYDQAKYQLILIAND